MLGLMELKFKLNLRNYKSLNIHKKETMELADSAVTDLVAMDSEVDLADMVEDLEDLAVKAAMVLEAMVSAAVDWKEDSADTEMEDSADMVVVVAVDLAVVLVVDLVDMDLVVVLADMVVADMVVADLAVDTASAVTIRRTYHLIHRHFTLDQMLPQFTLDLTFLLSMSDHMSQVFIMVHTHHFIT